VFGENSANFSKIKIKFFGRTPCVKNPKRFSFWYPQTSLILFYLIRFLVGASFEGSGSGFVFAKVAKIVKKNVKKTVKKGATTNYVLRTSFFLVHPVLVSTHIYGQVHDERHGAGRLHHRDAEPRDAA
jgi:hypothetical protein